MVVDVALVLAPLAWSRLFTSSWKDLVRSVRKLAYRTQM